MGRMLGGEGGTSYLTALGRREDLAAVGTLLGCRGTFTPQVVSCLADLSVDLQSMRETSMVVARVVLLVKL